MDELFFCRVVRLAESMALLDYYGGRSIERCGCPQITVEYLENYFKWDVYRRKDDTNLCKIMSCFQDAYAEHVSFLQKKAQYHVMECSRADK